MKKRIVLLVIAIVVIFLSLHHLKQEFPDLTWPVISVTKNPESPSENGSPYKFYYEKLTSVEKQAYNMVLDKIYDMPDRILVPDLNEDQLDNVFRALLYDNPDLFFIGRKCTLRAELWNNYLSIDYIVTKDEYLKQKEELETKCNEIIASLSNPQSNYQTELEIHNYIIDHCTYKIVDKEYVYSSSYGCLINGVAACEGYSKAAKLLFDKVGIENTLISGTATASQESGGAHMWNVVKIDGNYYHLDITWDDPVTTGKNLRLYTYFNVSDEEISKNHFDFSIDLNCSSSGADYYSKNSLTFSNYSTNDNNKLGSTLAEQYKSGEKQIQINFDNEESYNRAKKLLIEQSGIYQVLKNVTVNGNNLWNKFEGYLDGDSGSYTLTFIFK